MRHRMPCLMVTAVIAVVALTGCSQHRQPIRIGVSSWPPCEIWYVAEAEGFFGNLPVQVTRFSVWTDAMSALYRGSLDLANASYFSAMYYADKGEEARVILTSDTVVGTDGFVVREDMPYPEGLVGARVAVEVNTDEHFLLSKALESVGLDEKNITMISTTSERIMWWFSLLG